MSIVIYIVCRSLWNIRYTLYDIGWNDLYGDIGGAYSKISSNASVLKIEWLTGWEVDGQ